MKRRISWVVADGAMWVATGIVTVAVLGVLACAGVHAKLKGYAQ